MANFKQVSGNDKLQKVLVLDGGTGSELEKMSKFTTNDDLWSAK